MLPEDVADIERCSLQQRVASLLEQLGSTTAVELGHVDPVEREVLHGPLQPQLDVMTRPPARIYTQHHHSPSEVGFFQRYALYIFT